MPSSLPRRKSLGHTLSSVEMKTLFGIYDYLALPPEVIMMLINYCVARAASSPPRAHAPSLDAHREGGLQLGASGDTDARSGRGNTYAVSARGATRSAARRRRSASTAASLRRRRRSTSPRGSTWALMRTRSPSATTARSRTPALKWSYMNKIMQQSWHEKGCTPPQR